MLVDIDRGGVTDRVAKLDDERRHAISTVTVTELRLGVNKRYEDEPTRLDALEDLERLLARFEIVDVTREEDARVVLAPSAAVYRQLGFVPITEATQKRQSHP